MVCQSGSIAIVWQTDGTVPAEAETTPPLDVPPVDDGALASVGLVELDSKLIAQVGAVGSDRCCAASVSLKPAPVLVLCLIGLSKH